MLPGISLALGRLGCTVPLYTSRSDVYSGAWKWMSAVGASADFVSPTQEKHIVYVLRLAQIVSCPPLIPVGAILHDDAEIEALLAGAAGPIMFGLTSMFVLFTALIDKIRGGARWPPEFRE